jgi:uncharacterized membrane protein YsdA (DUF1294 family)
MVEAGRLYPMFMCVFRFEIYVIEKNEAITESFRIKLAAEQGAYSSCVILHHKTSPH